jgi:chitinase
MSVRFVGHKDIDMGFGPQRLLVALGLLVALSSANPLPPGPLIVGYANWGECDQEIVQGVRNGVNVVIWFAINLGKNATQAPTIHGGPNLTCVAETVKQIKDLNLPTTHLLSVGGWDAPHPDTSFSGQKWAEVWDTWNKHTAARPDLGFAGFDGLDWDLEGNDNKNSTINHFTLAQLQLMGDMSQSLKRKGYVVSMAPPQSYFDPSTPVFNRDLLNAPAYEPKAAWHPEFHYHGRNVYSYIVSKFGTTDGAVTFDFVSVQLYESFSATDYDITQRMVPAADYLASFSKAVIDGFHCDFGSDPSLNFSSRTVSLLSSQLVLGFSRGSRGDAKSVFIEPTDVGKAYTSLESKYQPR